MADYDESSYTKSVADIIYANEGKTVKEKLASFTEQTPTGNLLNMIGRAFYGFNHRGQPGLIPINKDYNGLTFFTRPDLNLSEDNLRGDRKMSRLITGTPFSMENIIRCYLDRNLIDGSKEGIKKVTPPFFIDNKQAFIPILTNTLVSLPGWPDDTNGTFTSDPGVYGEVYGFIDGPEENYGSYDLSANFRNIIGDPVTKLWYYWSRYAKLVHEGLKMIPYGENIVENRVDYNTRIYRLVLDDTKTYVTEIAACGAAIPVSTPSGAKFNYEADKPINDNNDQISVQLRCFGFIVYDDILIKEFNQTVEMFNPAMSDANREGAGYMKIPMAALQALNNYGYPHINKYTRELEWYVKKDTVYNHFQFLASIETDPRILEN